jgi:hypothetical protein
LRAGGSALAAWPVARAGLPALGQQVAATFSADTLQGSAARVALSASASRTLMDILPPGKAEFIGCGAYRREGSVQGRSGRLCAALA